jgi:hypothetical protein
MKLPTSKLGYTAAGVTVFAAVLVPFLLMNAFSRGFTRLGLHVDEVYSGGPTVRTIQASGYTIDINRLVHPHMWQAEKPFVQLAWTPATALPAHVSDTVDIDNDGQPDVQVSFDVPKDHKATLYVDVQPIRPGYEALYHVSKPSFSSLIARVDDRIVVRVPLKGK